MAAGADVPVGGAFTADQQRRTAAGGLQVSHGTPACRAGLLGPGDAKSL